MSFPRNISCKRLKYTALYGSRFTRQIKLDDAQEVQQKSPIRARQHSRSRRFMPRRLRPREETRCMESGWLVDEKGEPIHSSNSSMINNHGPSQLRSICSVQTLYRVCVDTAWRGAAFRIWPATQRQTAAGRWLAQCPHILLLVL